MKKVAVIGAGSWGTALSIVLADHKHEVNVWSHRQEQVNEINERNTNQRYLPNIQLSEHIVAYSKMEEAVKGTDAVLLVVPTKAIREVSQQLKPFLDPNKMIIHASKGIEPETHKRISEMLEDELGEQVHQQLVVLSGPSHAEEVALRQPTTITATSYNLKMAELTQDLFMNENFRVYTNEDVLGVEIGGALKNIIALGAGISDGLGYGDNAKSALITRGLAEIARLGTSLDANPLTFAGLAGVGDLIVTCTSKHSRNWRAGNMLGKGYVLQDVLDQMGMVVEGVRTTKAAYQLSRKLNIDMPITEGLYELLFDEKEPKKVVDELMNRGKTKELEDLSSFL
ncbi:NAD(P)H-dependent glycerol-3-phosphate dehydrogenase [Tenuibacillus multivorans]|uniref:Glycerol-3-phosphate dehydrogenase [NAD(P)+] n=1 Tax=Tenuibacillus multivorans TaxID=237069 RepID=A0A1H0CVM1_9BACI|nr:NAD(P)H-dependent glycerol-3-phosphate dehydrogenase [Tenuibacillus multivorans]GEL76146.1 glycerol-3-phosphate dehydrogenase [NAD(P)+] [Tenuibacillus multivorans]SDN61948.1 glycerol-3-phosphate dehydrogenase (NAD(P)+) [Tenuibacillus multivorans]